MKVIVDKLKDNYSVEFRPKGNSMSPIIKSGQLVRVRSMKFYNQPLKVGDVVLCRVKGNIYLHKISSIKSKNKTDFYQISNNRGFVNGWIGKDKVYGILTKVISD